MIDSNLLKQLTDVLSTKEAPNGCAQASVDPNKNYSFWDTLHQLPSMLNEYQSNSKSQQLDALIESTRKDINSLKLLSHGNAPPILAVCGLLNSGKSSLVAGFLSKKGRSRVLVGGSDEAGTHRFVIWLPESWRNESALWDSAMQHIEHAFGHAPELLDESPEIAHLQYNGRFTQPNLNHRQTNAIDQTIFATPLVATDPWLDTLQLGLMDCPDVQSGIFSMHSASVNESQSHGSRNDFHHQLKLIADQRARTLFKGLPIASGLILIVQANMIGDKTIVRLAEEASRILPKIKKFIAVNRVPKRYQESEIASEIALHFQSSIFTDHYIAYDFRGPDDDQKIPTQPQQWSVNQDDDFHKLPIFFSLNVKRVQGSTNSLLASGNKSQSRTTIEAKTPSADDEATQIKYLLDIAEGLDASNMAIDATRSTVCRAIDHLCQCKEVMDNAVSGSHERVTRLYSAIANAILVFSSNIDGSSSAIRLQISSKIIEQMQTSLDRTAPRWAKPSILIWRMASSAAKFAKQWTSLIPRIPMLSDTMTKTVETIRKRFKSGESGEVMTAQRLASKYRNSDTKGDLPLCVSTEKDPLVGAAERVIERFQLESDIYLDEEALDKVTALLWEQMSLKQKFIKGVAPATLILAPFLAVLTVPVDFGATHVLLFATAKELLVAGAASAGILLLQGDQFPDLAEGQAAWKQIGDLFAISCDEFGLPRPNDADLPELNIGNQIKKFLPSSTATGCSQVLSLSPIIEYQKSFEQRFDALIEDLKSAIP